MVCKSPPTELVDRKSYGISGFMGYLSHGLRGCRLYFYKSADEVSTSAAEDDLSESFALATCFISSLNFIFLCSSQLFFSCHQ